MDLILASLSPYRRELLARLGLPFRCVDSGVNEDLIKQSVFDPTILAESLARAKAESVAAHSPESVVIGGDQLVAFQGRMIGKPITAEHAVEQLLAFAGHEHQLITSVAVTDDSGTEIVTDVSTLLVRVLSRSEAERYVEADRPLDCAGSYKIEARGISLFDRIDSRDHTAIIGLPLLALSRMLRSRGFALP